MDRFPSIADYEKRIKDNATATGYSHARQDLAKILSKAAVPSEKMELIFNAMEKSYQERFSDAAKSAREDREAA